MRPMAVQRPSTVRSAALPAGFELGKGVLNRIEVRAIGRKVEKAGARRFDPLVRFLPLVARQIVHDDDIALAQLRREDALDIGLEGESVDRPVQHERRDQAACRQAGDDGRRFPVAVRNADPQALAAAAAAVGSGHVCGCPGLVDEHETVEVEIELAFEPRLRGASRRPADPVRWRAQSFFARDRVTSKEAADRAVADNNALLAMRAAQLLDRDVRLRLQEGQDRVFVSLNPLRTAVSARRPRPRLALLAFTRTPPAHARRAHPEPLADLTVT